MEICDKWKKKFFMKIRENVDENFLGQITLFAHFLGGYIDWENNLVRYGNSDFIKI